MKWTEEELDDLKQFVNMGKLSADIAQIMGRPVQEVAAQIERTETNPPKGIVRFRGWKSEKVDEVCRLAGRGMSDGRIGEVIDKSWYVVRALRVRMGIEAGSVVQTPSDG